jgi:hypothetical protein
MEPEAQAVIDKIAARYSSPDAALNQCSIACGHLINDLAAIGVSDVQRIEVSEPSRSTHPHPYMQAAHQVLRNAHNTCYVKLLRGHARSARLKRHTFS